MVQVGFMANQVDRSVDFYIMSGTILGIKDVCWYSPLAYCFSVYSLMVDSRGKMGN